MMVSFTVKNVYRRIKEKALLIFLGALIVSTGVALLEISINSAAITGVFKDYNEEFLFGCLLVSIVLSLVAYGDLINGIYHMNQGVYSLMQDIGYKKKKIYESFLLEIAIIDIVSIPIGLVFGQAVYRVFNNFIKIYIEAEQTNYKRVPFGPIILLVSFYLVSSIMVGLSKLRGRNQLYNKQKRRNILPNQEKHGGVFILIGAAIAFLIPAAGIISMLPSVLIVAYGIIHLIYGISKEKKGRTTSNFSDINSLFVSRYLRSILTRQGREVVFTIMILLVSFEVINFGVFFGKSEEFSSNNYPFAAVVEENVKQNSGNLDVAQLFGDVDYYTVRVFSLDHEGNTYDLISRSDYDRLAHISTSDKEKATARMANTTMSISEIDFGEVGNLLPEAGEVAVEPSYSYNLFNMFYTTENETHHALLILPDNMSIWETLTVSRLYHVAEDTTGKEKDLYEGLEKTNLRYYVRDVNVLYNRIIAARFYYMGIFAGLTLLLIGVGKTLTLYLEGQKSFIKDLAVINYNNTRSDIVSRIILKHSFMYVAPILIPFLGVSLQMVFFNTALIINKDLHMVSMIGRHMVCVMGMEIIIVCIYAMFLNVTTSSFVKKENLQK